MENSAAREWKGYRTVHCTVLNSSVTVFEPFKIKAIVRILPNQLDNCGHYNDNAFMFMIH